MLYFDWLKERDRQQRAGRSDGARTAFGPAAVRSRNPATNYYDSERNTLKITENVAQVFMGMRIQCAQCHNHPFDRWTMDDYYSFAAFFAQIGNKQAEDPREHIVFNRGEWRCEAPGQSGKVMAPKFLGGATAGCRRARSSRGAGRLAGVAGESVLRHEFGEHRVGSFLRPRHHSRSRRCASHAIRRSNPELLAELGKRFTESHYDFKKLVRDICTSRTYQLSSQTNESNAGDERNFSHSLVRRLRAEVLLDVITEVTDTKNKFPGIAAGSPRRAKWPTATRRPIFSLRSVAPRGKRYAPAP